MPQLLQKQDYHHVHCALPRKTPLPLGPLFEPWHTPQLAQMDIDTEGAIPANYKSRLHNLINLLENSANHALRNE
jgi:hypothetical protein